jgi:hypothetical protein
MEVVIDLNQAKRIGFNILDKIYGPLKKRWGEIYNDVYIDENWNPRIGVRNSILSPKGIFILKEDFLKFRSVIPVSELQFADIFGDWLKKNYSIENIDILTTTGKDKLKFIAKTERTNVSTY